jgi:hypothetical protein
VRCIVESAPDGVRHEVERAALDLVVDAADVFAEDPDRDQLHAA